MLAHRLMCAWCKVRQVDVQCIYVGMHDLLVCARQDSIFEKKGAHQHFSPLTVRVHFGSGQTLTEPVFQIAWKQN